jgi:hypothetical protein
LSHLHDTLDLFQHARIRFQGHGQGLLERGGRCYCWRQVLIDAPPNPLIHCKSELKEACEDTWTRKTTWCLSCCSCLSTSWPAISRHRAVVRSCPSPTFKNNHMARLELAHSGLSRQASCTKKDLGQSVRFLTGDTYQLLDSLRLRRHGVMELQRRCHFCFSFFLLNFGQKRELYPTG